MSKAFKPVLQVGVFAITSLAIGCQTNSGTPIGPGNAGPADHSSSAGPPRAMSTREGVPVPEYQTLDSGLRDCSLPFEQLQQSSPACTGGVGKNGRRCEPYSPSQFPEVVELRRGPQRTDELICTGTVVAADWIVTAAHCLVGDEPASASASFGNSGQWSTRLSVSAPFAYVLSAEYSHSAADQTRDVAFRYVMPSYSGAPQYEDDIALLKLARPFPARAVQPATLARADQISTETTMAGYGVSDAEGGSIGYLNVNWPAEVSDEGHRITFVPRDRTAFCKGDSGGPMFAGRYRGCKATDAGGEPRPRLLQAVVSSFSYKGIITPALSDLEQAKVCIDADRMIAQSLADAKVKNWICRATANQAQGC